MATVHPNDDRAQDPDSSHSLLVMNKTPATPIAVIGMACRLPGGIESPDQLWEALLRGDDLVTEIPAGPLGRRRVLRPRARRAGSVGIASGARFSTTSAGFDSEFFGISEQEATAIDPQHRLLLETSWEAMEHAGLRPETMAGSLTGVFVGLTHGDYQFAGRRRALRGGAVRIHRHHFQHGVRADRLRPGGPRSGGHGGHGMLFWSVRCAYGVPQSARRRKRSCPGGRRHGDAGPAEVFCGVGAGHAVARPDAAMRSTSRRTGSCLARAAPWCCSSGCRTRSATVTGFWPWCAARPPTRTAAP